MDSYRLFQQQSGLRIDRGQETPGNFLHFRRRLRHFARRFGGSGFGFSQKPEQGRQSSQSLRRRQRLLHDSSLRGQSVLQRGWILRQKQRRFVSRSCATHAIEHQVNGFNEKST